MAGARKAFEKLDRAEGVSLSYGDPGAAGSSASALEREHMALMSGDRPGEEFKPWASVVYGSLVKDARRKAGYVKAEDFGRAVWRRTRVYLSRDVMYKIEQGRQDPTVVQFMAINLTLFGAPVPSRVTMPCICPEWIEIAANDGGAIPPEWMEENTRKLEEQTGRRFTTPEEAAEAAKDVPWVFAPVAAEG